MAAAFMFLYVLDGALSGGGGGGAGGSFLSKRERLILGIPTVRP